MPGFTSYADMLAEYEAGKNFHREFYKSHSVAPEIGHWTSLWYDSGTPAAGADPAGTPGEAYANHASAFSFADVDPDRKLLLRLSGSCNDAIALMLYDRLVGVSGITLDSTGDKTVNSAALTRYTSGIGVEAWLEITTAQVGSTTLSMSSYTNDAGTAARDGASATFAGLNQRTMFFLPLKDGANDKGVRSLETINVSVETASAGVANLILLKPIAYIPIPPEASNEREFVLDLSKYPRIYDDATLALMAFCGSSGSFQVTGGLELVYG